MIIPKFGGTSVASAEAIERVADIVAARAAERPVVVVSAMGKTTDRLLELATTAVEGTRKRVVELLRNLRDFHGREARKLVPPARRAALETCLEEHFQELSQLRRIAHVSYEGGKAIVCLVGDNIKFTPGIAGKVFKAIEKVNVRMISQGASVLNISFVVDEDRLKEVVSRLHRTFFRKVDPRVFE